MTIADRDRWTAASRWALTAAAVSAVAALFVMRPFVPSLPAGGLDAAWVATLGELSDRGAVWGRDVAFTYGPASPVVTHYPTASFYARVLPIVLALSAAFGVAMATLAFAAPARGLMRWVFMPAALLVLCAQGALPDGFLVVLPFALLLASSAGSRAAAAGAALGAFAVGLAALSKTTFPLAAMPVFLLGDALALSRRRPPPLLVPFLIGAGLATRLFGMGLGDLVGYAAMQGEVVLGYAAAMGRAGSPAEVLMFVAAAALLLAETAVAGRGREGVAAVAGLGIACFFLFKAGFVRHDTHSLIAWRGLALLATVAAVGRLRPPAGLAACAAALLAVYACAPALELREAGREASVRSVARADAEPFRDGADEAAAAWRLAADPSGEVARLRAAKAQAWTDLATAEPLAPLPGAVDALPSEGARVMANGLDYRPRPSFAEYSTYTPALAAANRAFLEGPRAPRWFLFGPEPDGALSIDGRYPNLAEGALWPALLSRYRPDRRVGPLLALERRPEPVALPMGPARVADVPLGADLVVDEPAPVWAEVEARPNLLGRIAAALYRPPALDIAVDLADGSERSFRFVPGLGQAGFLVSPLVENASDFADLAVGRAAGAGRRVVRMRVSASPAGARSYEPTMRVSLRALDVSALRGPAPPASLGSAWDRLAVAVPASALEGPERVAATAPTTLAIPAAGLTRAALAFGVEDEAWRREGSAGACFAMRMGGGPGATLWQTCLDPAGVPADRGRHLVEVDLPSGTTELRLETACRLSCAAAWGYWEKPEPRAAEAGAP